MARFDIYVDIDGAIKIDQLKGKVDQLNQQNTRVAKTSQTASRAMIAMGTAAAGALSIGKVVQYADAWTGVESRLKLVTKNTQELEKTQTALFNVAEKSRSSFTDTATLYTRMANATKSMNVSQDELLRTTETINKALVISGASTAESSSAILQLSQAMASGVLRGEEFNSISENGSEILNILGQSLGKTTGELRKMASEGEITTKVLIDGLAKGAETVDEKFKSMNLTVSQALQSFDNNMGKIIDRAANGTGVMGNFAKSIQWFGEAINIADEYYFGLSYEDQLYKSLIETQDDYYHIQKRNAGLIKEEIIPLSIATAARIEEVSEFLGVHKDTLEGLTDQEIDFAEASKVANDALTKYEQAAQAAYDADMALYETNIQLTNQILKENDALEDNTQEKLTNSQATEQLAESTTKLAQATSFLHDAEGNLRDDVFRSSSGGVPLSNDGYSTTSINLNPLAGFAQKELDYKASITSASYSTQSFTSTIDDFEYSTFDAIDTLEDFVFEFENSFIRSLENNISLLSSLSSVTVSNSLSYSSALKLATTARAELIANPLSVSAGQNFTDAYNTFTSAASNYTSDTSMFQSAEQQAFAKASVGVQTRQFESTARSSVDVLESMNTFLGAIEGAMADGYLSDEEKSKLTTIAADVNTNNDKLLGSETKLYTGGDIKAEVNTISGFAENKTFTSTNGLKVDNAIADVSGLMKNDTFSDKGITNAELTDQKLYTGGDIKAEVNTVDVSGLYTGGDIGVTETTPLNISGLATDENVSAQTYYDNTDLMKNATFTDNALTSTQLSGEALYKGTDINANVNTVDTSGLSTDANISSQTYYDNEGLETSEHSQAMQENQNLWNKYITDMDTYNRENLEKTVKDQTYYDNTDLAKNAALIGTNSISDVLSAFSASDGGINIAGLASGVDALNVATGLDTNTGSIKTATEATAVNTAVSGGLLSGVSQSITSTLTPGPKGASYPQGFTTRTTDTYSYLIEPEVGSNVLESVTTIRVPIYTNTGYLSGKYSESTEYEYYADGGFTGRSLARADITGERPAGIVHEGEWVAPRSMVQNNPQLFSGLESMRQGAGSNSQESSGYMFVLANEMKKLTSLMRQVTNGGDAMRTELVR